MTYWNNLVDKNFGTYDEVKNWLRDNISKWWAAEDNGNLCVKKFTTYVSNLTDTEFLEMVKSYDPAIYEELLDEYIDDVAFHTTFKENESGED